MASDVTQDAPIAPPPLDPALLQVIWASVDRLIQLKDAFIRQLQYELTTLMPDSASLRAADGWAFCERMAHTLLWVAVTDQPLDAVADTLRQLGARNWLDGFSETQYVSVAHALLRAVRDLCVDDWSTSMSSAWISYFMRVKPHLVFGAEQAAARQAAARAQAAEQDSRGFARPDTVPTRQDSASARMTGTSRIRQVLQSVDQQLVGLNARVSKRSVPTRPVAATNEPPPTGVTLDHNTLEVLPRFNSIDVRRHHSHVRPRHARGVGDRGRRFFGQPVSGLVGLEPVLPERSFQVWVTVGGYPCIRNQTRV